MSIHLSTIIKINVKKKPGKNRAFLRLLLFIYQDLR